MPKIMWNDELCGSAAKFISQDDYDKLTVEQQNNGTIYIIDDGVPVVGDGNGASSYLIGNTFSTANQYSVGDYCIYNGILYKCKSAVTEPGKFNNDNWEATDVTTELGSASIESIDYNTWMGYSDEERAAYGLVKITNAPEAGTSVAYCQEQINELKESMKTSKVETIEYDEWSTLNEDEKDEHGLVKVINAPEELTVADVNQKVEEINDSLDSLKKSVSDGKTLVANAITAKGISTATDAEFATMSSNIGKIVSTLSLMNYSTTGFIPRPNATANVSFSISRKVTNGILICSWCGCSIEGQSCSVSGGTAREQLRYVGINMENDNGVQLRQWIFRISGEAGNSFTIRASVSGDWARGRLDYVLFG